GCNELKRTCPAHGKTTFGQLFAPLKKSLFYLFVPELQGKVTLFIKRGPAVPVPKPRPRSLRVWVVGEDGQPRPGASIENLVTKKVQVADAEGMVTVDHPSRPVPLRITYVGMDSVTPSIMKDTEIMLYNKSQSLEETTVSYFSTTREVSTNTYTS